MYYGSREHIEMRKREAEIVRREHSKTGKPAQRNTESLADFKQRMRLTLKGTHKKARA